MLSRWIRLLTQAFTITVLIVMAALVFRGIYLHIAQPPQAEIEGVSDIARPVPGCHGPYAEQKGQRDRGAEQQPAMLSGCLES